MSSQKCWQCITRASDPALLAYRPAQQPRISLPASKFLFSTSASSLHDRGAGGAGRAKKSSVKDDVPVRGRSRNFIAKKKTGNLDRGKRPAVGERKALRKRIVLSNTNALEVHGMQDITAASIVDEGLRGQVLGIPGPVVDQLRAVEAFKVPQSWALFRRPAMLIRRETVDFGKEMEQIEQDKTKSIRRVLVGDRGSGKSLMLLQAMTMAFLKKWVVINIPNAQDIILAQSEYGPLPGTNPPLYTQPTNTAALLSAISRANPILSDLQLSQSNPSQSSLPVPIPPNISLSRLALLGASDPENAYPIFQLLLSELKSPNRPPLMLCLDGLAHIMCDTKYIAPPSYKPIHAHSFTIPKFFLEHLSGSLSLPNGGVVMAATSNSNNPVVPSLDLALGQLEGKEEVRRDPFGKYDERVLGVFNGGGGVGDGDHGGVGNSQGGAVEVQRIGGVGKEEARALMEYWAKSGVCRQRVDEGFVGEKWSLSGGGVVGELERAVVRMRF